MNKLQQEERYRTKSEECYRAAHNARTPIEQQAWLELGRDWDRLADEVRDLVDAPLAQLDAKPEIIRVFQPCEEPDEV